MSQQSFSTSSTVVKPVSLLEKQINKSPTRKRKRLMQQLLVQQQQQQEENKNDDDDHHPVIPNNHICGLPIPVERFGVCGLCGNGGEADTILLCDGPNCGKEFHMKCNAPPLYVIPEGNFFCFDCSKKGSTAQLGEFFFSFFFFGSVGCLCTCFLCTVLVVVCVGVSAFYFLYILFLKQI